MSASRWRDVVATFDQLVELEPDARDERLVAIGKSDPKLLRDVERLLAADAQADERLACIDHCFGTCGVGGAARKGDADPLRLIGQTISHFRIIELLAHGGMGIVYRAEDTHLRRPIALKFPLPGDSLDRSSRERFLHEARVAGALDHPNLCAISEAGETSDGELFFAMPLYEGETLKERVARDRALPIADALGIAKQIAAGLSAAHEPESSIAI